MDKVQGAGVCVVGGRDSTNGVLGSVCRDFALLFPLKQNEWDVIS